MAEERRMAPRVGVEREVGGRSPATPFRALIRNISSTGCKAGVGLARIEQGATVLLDFPEGAAISGQVVWRRDGEIGVEFHQPLSDSLVIAIAEHDEYASTGAWRVPEKTA